MAGLLVKYGEGEKGREPTYLWVAIICSTRRNHFSKVNNKPHYRQAGDKNEMRLGEGEVAWVVVGLKSRQRPEGVSHCGWKQGWCVSHQSGCIHMSQELVICSICVCSTSTSTSSSSSFSNNNNNNVATHTPHNVDVAWWVSGDKTGRGAKFAQACNIPSYKNNRVKHEGKTEKRMRNKNREMKLLLPEKMLKMRWDCMAEQVLQAAVADIQL